MKRYPFLFTVLCVVLLVLSTISCSKKSSLSMIDQNEMDTKLLTVHELTPDYLKEIEKWRTNRYKSITSPQGWLSLVGLHWLKEGENVLGSSPESDVQLPEFLMPRIGSIFLENGNVRFRAKGENFISSENKPQADGTIKHDGQGAPTILNEGSLYMHVIKRGDRYGLRVKNTLADARFKLKEIPNFSADASLIRTTKFIPVESKSQMDVNSVIGVDISYDIEGYLIFEYEDKLHKLTAFDGGTDYLFVLIKDETSGDSSYGAGRFIDVKRPIVGNPYTLLDFNKAYNPPCAFTEFATCPLPPKENHLPFLVTAGEKNIKSH